ncbi:polar amino acid transport system ATP-binding protein [Anaerosolibacter carboniphilus]|uniref:Polar amino acid transport system ATP-binding protein n=2 Tax=Anaerosolibacter carboniphilus TaxID=1417629 RepID=A0A841KZ31_9FIRM|nr:polar amino acid transport system ATP-binding protein [Anaerosolibacter carboniphilus]
MPTMNNKEEKIVLEGNGLVKAFQRNPVLKSVSFQVKTGEIVAIIGRSGAGKTTLLRCINGLEFCDSGSIEIDGFPICKDVNGKSVYASQQERRQIRKNVGMVFQNFNLFPHLSVLKNITASLIKVYGMDKQEANERAMKLLEKMDLAEKAEAYPFQLSGGQKQRVAIARACALNPQIMCFDEPTSALDPELREGIAKIIEDLAKSQMAVLIITHDMAFAKRVATRVIFMEEGRILEEGDGKGFFNQAESERVKKFIGTSFGHG